MKLTQEQLELLNDVFSYALNALEETAQEGIMFVQNEKGEFEKFDVENKTEDIMKLAEYMQENFEIVKEES